MSPSYVASLICCAVDCLLFKQTYFFESA